MVRCLPPGQWPGGAGPDCIGIPPRPQEISGWPADRSAPVAPSLRGKLAAQVSNAYGLANIRIFPLPARLYMLKLHSEKGQGNSGIGRRREQDSSPAAFRICPLPVKPGQSRSNHFFNLDQGAKTTAALHPSTTPPLHHSITPSLQYSTGPPGILYFAVQNQPRLLPPFMSQPFRKQAICINAVSFRG